MKYQELQKKMEKYALAVSLDDAVSLDTRHSLKMFFFWTTVILASIMLLSFFHAVSYIKLVKGAFMLSLGLSLFLFCLDAFFFDFYMDDFFLAAKAMLSAKSADAVSGLLKSKLGQTLMFRLNISPKEIMDFVATKKNKISLSEIELGDENAGNLFENFVAALDKNDTTFHDFIFSRAVKESELRGAAVWLANNDERQKATLRWWGRDNLGKTQGIGKDWSYGQTFALEKYAKKIEEVYDFSSCGLGNHQKEIDQMETVLSRGKEENILLVSDDDAQKIDMVVELAKKINDKKIPSLENKVVFVLDINDIIVGKKTKTDFEKEITGILNQTARAGNIILVLKSLSDDLFNLLSPYFSSGALQIIAESDVGNFHQRIENNAEMMEKFEIMLLPEEGEKNLISNLEEKVDYFEKMSGVFFTYPALAAVVENASRFFSGQIVSDKANNILSELPQFVLKRNKKIVTKKDVLDLMQTKTDVPVGEAGREEKDKLLHLEKILHERIVSQDEAVAAIGSAMRRARAGIESSKRPIGSFLFFGPTGVGKTETAKALAEVFFGSEKKIIRLDMSEYGAPDSLSKMLGSFESGKPGVLTSLLRENQSGVLLLDEFEKADHEIHNLFLQILDEGIFSDMLGKKVNARNLIIVATSNAGSDIIWDFVKQSKDLAENKQNIIDTIIHRGVFKPELINRFDGVILFHPLSDSDLKQIAGLMLRGLQKRLEEKGLALAINDELVDYLVGAGSDPAFGARPINRAIQNVVEELIARKLLSGEVKPGQKVSLTRMELESVGQK